MIMEVILKTIIYLILTVVFSIVLIFIFIKLDRNVMAANGNSTSDLQLMARAINRRSKRRII